MSQGGAITDLSFEQVPLVTSLPTSPVDGQECYFLADATNGVVWHLRYRAASASAYKWEYVGGPPLFAFYAPQLGVAGSATWLTHASSPRVTIPLVGDYDFSWGSMQQQNANGFIAAGLDKANHTAWNTYSQQPAGSVNYPLTASMDVRYAVTAVGVCQMMFYGSGGGPLFSNTWQKVTPVRVG